MLAEGYSWNFRLDSNAVSELLEAADFENKNHYLYDNSEESFNFNEDLENKFIISYYGHGFMTGWTGIYTEDLINNNVLLSPSVVIGEACSTCAFTLMEPGFDSKADLFCMNLLRRGAIAYIGGVDSIWADDAPGRILFEQMFGESVSVGEAFKNYGNYKLLSVLGSQRSMGENSLHYFDKTFALFGDPTINFNLSYPDIEKIEHSFELVDNELILTVIVPESEKVILREEENKIYEPFDIVHGKNVKQDHKMLIKYLDIEEILGLDLSTYVFIPEMNGLEITNINKVEADGQECDCWNSVCEDFFEVSECKAFRSSCLYQIGVIKDLKGNIYINLETYNNFKDIFGEDWRDFDFIPSYEYKIYLELDEK